MNGSGLDRGSPHIHITLDAGGVRIEQHRPAVLEALSGLPVERAMTAVPTLLPICGTAQSVAAARAVEAARGESPTAEQERERERQLWREQALSAAWRLALDWADLVGATRPMVWLKAVRAAETDDGIACLLRDALPGLESVWSVEALEAWAAGEECIAAQVARSALDQARPDRAGATLYPAGSATADRARQRLGSEQFDHLAAVDEAVAVGPLAVAREPLVPAVLQRFGAGTASRLLAMLLDIRLIIGRLGGSAASGGPETNAWTEGAWEGSGRAQTARGPVFHRVQVDDRGRVASWRALAPTDWHFAPGGPLARALADCESREQARLAVASFDPCAPWTLQMGHED